MSVENKIKFIMRDVNKSRSDIAEVLKISEAAVSNKFYRDSFSAEDLIKIADCLGFNLAFINDDKKVIFDLTDIKTGDNN
jgi:transcriptional regulator with XRE-family HTH domain